MSLSGGLFSSSSAGALGTHLIFSHCLWKLVLACACLYWLTKWATQLVSRELHDAPKGSGRYNQPFFGRELLSRPRFWTSFVSIVTASGTGTFPLELRVLRKYVLLCCGLVFISGNVRGLCREGPVVLTEGFTPNCCNDTIGTSHSSFHPGGIESEHANETRTNSIQGRYCLFTKKELALIPKSGSGSFGSFPSYLMLLGHGLGSWSEEGNLKVAPPFRVQRPKRICVSRRILFSSLPDNTS